MPKLTANIPLSEQVAINLRTRLAAGEFPVGSRIPTEHELTEELGVSRNSVREAVRALVHAGLLRAQAGSGTYVVATCDLGPALARHIVHDHPSDTAEVRLILEREAARLAARRANDEGLSRLRELLEKRDGTMTTDVAFHQHLVELAGNALLAELYRGVGGVEEAHFRAGMALEPAPPSHDLSELDGAHRAIVDAVTAGDSDAAGGAVERNIRLAQAMAPRSMSAIGATR